MKTVSIPLFVLVVVLGAAVMVRSAPPEITHHDLDVELRPESNALRATDRIIFTVTREGAVKIYLGDMLRVTGARLDGRRIRVNRSDPETGAADGTADSAERSEWLEYRSVYRLPAVAPGEHVLEVDYRGTVDDTLKVPENSRSGIPEETNGWIGGEGSYLGGYRTGWYPDVPDAYATFSIRVTTPAGTEAVTEGRRVSVERGDKSTVTVWEAGYPTRDLTLMAGPYVVREREVDGTTAMAYFFPGEADLVDTYLDASGGYIELYNRLIGPYPFAKFAVVENFFPTGYGMPSYTLLGRRVVRMPFIVKTSLGHEVAHNWWGNGVYVDHDRGNWCEGLTTYYADYRYEAQKSDSAAAYYRRDINVDYATGVADSTDIPLSQFRSREDGVTAAIGYGKCTMVFHMLARRAGEDKFYRAMRSFYRRHLFSEAGWDDIEAAFEETLGEPLDRFFDQWVGRPGAPELTIEDVRLDGPDGADGHYCLALTIRNRGGFRLARVPVHIHTGDVTREIYVAVDDTIVSFDWRLDRRPERLEVDPDHHVFRRLAPADLPVTIARALADKKPLFVLPSSAPDEKTAAYRRLADRLANTEGARVADDTTVSRPELAGAVVFVLGDPTENGVYRSLPPPDGVSLPGGAFRLAGDTWDEPGHAGFVAFPNVLARGGTVCAIFGNSAAAVDAAGYKVIYYGKYSFVTFLDGQKQATGVFPVSGGRLVHRFTAPAPGGPAPEGSE